MSDEEDLSLGSIFTEPPRPPTPEPTIASFSRQKSTTDSDWNEITIRLVGAHPLWGNYLWNAARALASYLDDHVDLYKDKNVLELGAGGALPSIIATKNGARNVVITDYPDDNLVNNIIYNVEANVSGSDRERIFIYGYIWGRSVEPLLKDLPKSDTQPAFDLIILSDLIFNHSAHDDLLKTCELTLSPSSDNLGSSPSCVLVFYTHHTPRLAHRDMIFFEKAKERGWHCEEIVNQKFAPMFPNDSGEESIRSTVHGWRLSRAHTASVV